MADKSGYIQSVDSEALIRLARESKTLVKMERGIGEFVVQNTPLASFAMDAPPDQARVDDLQATFSIARHRTVDLDAAFGIRQIVDMALKALSPGINDTTTAVMCVDYLTMLLARIVSREIPSPYRYEDGKLRVIAKGPSFESLLNESFDQIRENAKGNIAILSRMLDAFETLSSLTVCARRRRALSEQVQWLSEMTARSVESVHDRASLDIRLSRLHKALHAEPVLEKNEKG